MNKVQNLRLIVEARWTFLWWYLTFSWGAYRCFSHHSWSWIKGKILIWSQEIGYWHCRDSNLLQSGFNGFQVQIPWVASPRTCCIWKSQSHQRLALKMVGQFEAKYNTSLCILTMPSSTLSYISLAGSRNASLTLLPILAFFKCKVKVFENLGK